MNVEINPDLWFTPEKGPRYQQLHRYLRASIASGDIPADAQFPPEREMAERAGVSRVTLRQTIALLVKEGLVMQKRGAGTFVLPQVPKVSQSLSSLVSFTETMQSLGRSSQSHILSTGLFSPTSQEVVTLGLGAGARVARISRLRSSDGIMVARATTSLPEAILHKPDTVQHSLYYVLQKEGRAPTRALQRVSAINLEAREADLLNMREGDAALKIVRTGYLGSGRPIELTEGIYRSEVYDFVTELRIEGSEDV